jgi:hypothetical protein
MVSVTALPDPRTELIRSGADEFFALAQRPNFRTRPPYPLEKANEALDDLRAGDLRGAAALLPCGRAREVIARTD